MSLKVVKFDTKMYLNFSNFRGRTSAGGGGQALVQKQGQVSDGGGGLAKFLPFCQMGGPPSPQEKTLLGELICTHNLFYQLLFHYFCVFSDFPTKEEI